MGLINALKGLTPLAEVHVVKLKGMSKSRRMELFNRARVCLSLCSLRRKMLRLIWLLDCYKLTCGRTHARNVDARDPRPIECHRTV